MFKFILPSLNFKIEKWKWNKEYRIYVSTLGNFKDEYKQALPIQVGTGGYCRVKTARGSKFAHRLVMLTWKPIPDAENLTVDHLNHNKRENTIYNLEWVTKKENTRRSQRDLVIDQNARDKYKIAVLANGRVFESYHEAIDFAKSKYPKNQLKNIKDENIRHKIKHSIRTGEKYLGIKWNID